MVSFIKNSQRRLGSQRNMNSKCVPIFACSFFLMPIRYIYALHAYVLSFAKRTRPLEDIMGQEQVSETEFASLWAEDKIPDWSDASKARASGNGQDTGIWCGACEFRFF